MSTHRIRNTIITLFVILWMGVYHYMSVKHFYLEPFFNKPLARVPMLFPPAGWIMFYSVDDQFAEAKVYGIRGLDLNVKGRDIELKPKNYNLIDPHEIFRTRTILFDNIKRGLMHGAVARQRQFCRFLEFRFPGYDAFEVRYEFYPSITEKPRRRIERTQYQCLAQHYIDENLR